MKTKQKKWRMEELVDAIKIIKKKKTKEQVSAPYYWNETNIKF